MNFLDSELNVASVKFGATKTGWSRNARSKERCLLEISCHRYASRKWGLEERDGSERFIILEVEVYNGVTT